MIGNSKQVIGAPMLRSSVHGFSRQLLPHPHHSSGGGSSGGSGSGGDGSDYYGCLDLNATEQEEIWPDGPTCDYEVDTSGDDGNGTVTEYETTDDSTSSNPYEDFVVSKCDTYQNLWRWDLHMSCGGDNQNTPSCNCTFAEELFDKGLLVCEDRDRCPRNCPICSTCLSILGCPDASNQGPRMATSSIIYIIIGAVVLTVVGLALFHSHRRRQQQNDLKQQLIAEDIGVDGDVERSNSGNFEPPVVGSAGVGTGGAMVATGMAWKSANDSTSDSETTDCAESLDATIPNVKESTVSPVAGAFIATVRSEEEDEGPEDENEKTKNDSNLDATSEEAGETLSADVGAVREAFLQSLEEKDQAGGVESEESSACGRNESLGESGEDNSECESSSNQDDTAIVSENESKMALSDSSDPKSEDLEADATSSDKTGDEPAADEGSVASSESNDKTGDEPAADEGSVASSESNE